MKHFFIYFLFIISFSIDFAFFQTTKEKELEFLSRKVTTTVKEVPLPFPFQPLKSVKYQIYSFKGNCISAYGNGNSLVQAWCKYDSITNDSRIKWVIYKTTKAYFFNYYHIYTVDCYMSNSGYRKNIKNGNPVIGYWANNSIDQKWKLEKVNNGQNFRFRLFGTQFCLDNGNSTEVNTIYVIWECNINNSNQWFGLVEIK